MLPPWLTCQCVHARIAVGAVYIIISIDVQRRYSDAAAYGDCSALVYMREFKRSLSAQDAFCTANS
jgi:hypothetical protein